MQRENSRHFEQQERAVLKTAQILKALFNVFTAYERDRAIYPALTVNREMSAGQLARIIGEEDPANVLQALQTLRSIEVDNINTQINLAKLKSVLISQLSPEPKQKSRDARRTKVLEEVLNYITEKKDGVTLEEVCDSLDWSQHQVRWAVPTLLKGKKIRAANKKINGRVIRFLYPAD